MLIGLIYQKYIYTACIDKSLYASLLHDLYFNSLSFSVEI